MLGLIPEDMDAILENADRLEELQSDVAKLYDIPQIVDLANFFENPHDLSEDVITDALSDEFGWLVKSWAWHEGDNQACNSDNNDNIINHQDQPTNLEENNMETNNISTPSVNEDSMITQLFQQFIDNGGEPKVTEFKKHLNELINSDIKPLCGRAGKAASGDDWRSELKERFSGRGAKWVFVPINEISLTLTNFQAQGINCDNFISFIETKGAAWIRFSGPRIHEGQPAAAFEVRVDGSTIDHPRHLHMIPVNVLDETIRPLGGTPNSLKLEQIQNVQEETEEETETSDEMLEAITDVAQEEVHADIDEPSLDDIFNDFNDDFDDLNDEDFA